MEILVNHRNIETLLIPPLLEVATAEMGFGLIGCGLCTDVTKAGGFQAKRRPRLCRRDRPFGAGGFNERMAKTVEELLRSSRIVSDVADPMSPEGILTLSRRRYCLMGR